MKISKFITKTLMDLLDEKRIVVWYDSPGDFTDFAQRFNAAKCKVVSAVESSLTARRAADDIYVKMNASSDMAEASAKGAEFPVCLTRQHEYLGLEALPRTYLPTHS